MKTGRVKWFKAEKGYGFIAGDDGLDVFVHFSGIAMQGYKTLEDGQAVRYETRDSDKGLVAFNVTVIN